MQSQQLQQSFVMLLVLVLPALAVAAAAPPVQTVIAQQLRTIAVSSVDLRLF
jgi:hypothetical protein